MSIHNIHFYNLIQKNPKTSLNICFLKQSETKIMDSKTSSNRGTYKLAIGDRVIGVLLCCRPPRACYVPIGRGPNLSHS